MGARRHLSREGGGSPPRAGLAGDPPLCRSLALEALKSLLSSTGHWQDLALLELQGTWELFATIHTYPQGVGLLAR